MNLRYRLKTARDLFDKLLRDFELLDDEVTSDRMFNFVVTACHLPEWFERDETISPATRSRIARVKDSPLHRACRDIANASKHFRLDSRHAQSSQVKNVSSGRGYSLGRYGKGGYGIGEESISIDLESGERTDALEFARKLVRLFENAVEHKSHSDATG